ncbi:hypothetical protein NA57DRAFT_80399 [Rhizodiscina lignyota]|uniref:Uncharacterized protein n=1 Tax=Rhizodiscina lignyota TaxID=1504668 RepID=A0A9P4M2J7_9PEZI|nr:hypothetical protein NA57DRAFT_80399 [Rhizodiscina lignyota]
MYSLAPFLITLLPLAAAAPTSHGDISVIWRHEKGSSAKSLQVWNGDETVLLGQACSDKVDDGNFAKEPISFDVDADGSGTVTYGSSNYKVHSKPDHSGGIVCSKMYNGDFAKVVCSIPSKGTSYTSIPTNVTEDCFSESSIHFPKHYGFPKSEPVTKKSKRTDAPPACTVFQSTSMIADGNPHQNYWDSQLSGPISCGAAVQCTVGQEDSQSFSVGWSADLVATEWISGGFSVDESWETGNEYQCTAGTGETVCIWYGTAHTAYTVQNNYDTTCNEDSTGGPFVMYSPNANNAGGVSYYCVVGPCSYKGAGYWDKSGPAGGPP